MKIITFCMLKGGTGKSTLSYNITATRASLNKNEKYLLIDLDLQANLSNFLGIESYENVGKDSSDMILGDVDPEDVVIKSPLKYCPNLDIIPGSFNIFKNDIRLNNSSAKEYRLDRVINRHKDFFEKYDYVIIDTNPSFGILNINAFYVSDVIINVVKNNCISSLKALQIADNVWSEVKQDLAKEKPEIQKIIINMVDDRSNSAKQFKEIIYSLEGLDNKLLNSRVRNSVSFVNSVLECKTVYEYDKNHKATQDILAVLDELEQDGIFENKTKTKINN